MRFDARGFVPVTWVASGGAELGEESEEGCEDGDAGEDNLHVPQLVSKMIEWMQSYVRRHSFRCYPIGPA